MFSFFKKPDKSPHSHEHAGHAHDGGCCGDHGHDHEPAVDEEQRTELEAVAPVTEESTHTHG